jgi:hypothetical protein
MKQEQVAALCESIRAKLKEDSDEHLKGSKSQREAELFFMGISLLEAFLVNQARIADTLNKMMIDQRNR